MAIKQPIPVTNDYVVVYGCVLCIVFNKVVYVSVYCSFLRMATGCSRNNQYLCK
jgi:hypothetical protein